MARCEHGFERSAVPCPDCDATEAKRDHRSPRVRRGPYAPGTRPVHPSFQDLTGKQLKGAIVVQRAANNVRGTACWLLRLPCGHERVVQGIQIRVHERDAKKGFRCNEPGCEVKP